MTQTHVVDAKHASEELNALCNAAGLFLQGSFPQGHESAKNHAQCLYQLLGGFGAEIVAKSGRSLTTTYLRELSHNVPWQIEFMAGAENCHPSWQILTADEIALLRRWLELIRLAEREYTPDEVPKGLICSALKISSDTFQRRVRKDPGLIHPDYPPAAQNVRFAIDALVNTEIYLPDQRAAAVFEHMSKAKKTKVR